MNIPWLQKRLGWKRVGDNVSFAFQDRRFQTALSGKADAVITFKVSVPRR